MHTLTLDQFLQLIPDGAGNKANNQAVLSNGADRGSPPKENGSRSRSQSVSHAVNNLANTEERMRHTREFKLKGFKANSRESFIQAPFATLDNLFRKLPRSLGFNIEVKYPMIHEADDQNMGPYALEMNQFCDIVLSKVYEFAGQRRIVFSSFNPNICLCLKLKQPSIPVMFLTDAGVVNVCDTRSTSLQEAIRFATRWNLLGIVSAAEPLTNSPRLIGVVREKGLVCASYGRLNNFSDMVQVSDDSDALMWFSPSSYPLP